LVYCLLAARDHPEVPRERWQGVGGAIPRVIRRHPAGRGRGSDRQFHLKGDLSPPRGTPGFIVTLRGRGRGGSEFEPANNTYILSYCPAAVYSGWMHNQQVNSNIPNSLPFYTSIKKKKSKKIKVNI